MVALEMDFPAECFKHLAMTDMQMTFEQASLVNPAGSIQRLHDAGPHLESCWIHSRHAEHMRGVARNRCLGCYWTFGVDNGLDSNLPQPDAEFTEDVFWEVLGQIRAGAEENVICLLENTKWIFKIYCCTNS